MAPSQLKRLKSSLREQGIIGPQKSKKQKKAQANDVKGQTERRLRKAAALGSIREQFNPFDLKHSRGPKFEVTTNKPPASKGVMGRPGVTKAVGEQRRQETLLVEMQRRNKVGGILDRRIGEYDPNMALEDKMLERFVAEKQRSHKKSSLFDLEDEEPVSALTHNGQALTFDDYNDNDDDMSDNGSDISMDERKKIKRQRFLEQLQADRDAAEEANEDGQPKVKKSKQEVMKELIAKSKMHKYERQAAKEDDLEVIADIDKETHDVLNLLLGSKPKRDAVSSEKTVTKVAGMDRADFERDFDKKIRLLADDTRSKPAERTKTDEEIAAEQSEKLKKLEEKRLKRMNGEEDSSESETSDDETPTAAPSNVMGDYDEDNEGEDFGLGAGIKTRHTAADLGFDDEDDFLIDDDLVASGSDVDIASSDEDDGDDSSDDQDKDGEEEEEEEEDEFAQGLRLTAQELQNPAFETSGIKTREGIDESGLPYTFPCPQSLDELLTLVTAHPFEKIPTIVQRIRALYHPSLDSSNKDKLSHFVESLVDFVASCHEFEGVEFAVIESVSRHIHSMAKMFPINVAKQCRKYITELAENRPLAPTMGDLVLLTVIGSMFPTSDHFHQVVTPAMLCMGRYLGQKVPQNVTDYAIGAFFVTLVLQYQQIAKRFVPEVFVFALNALVSFAPVKPSTAIGSFPIHEPVKGIRISKAQNTAVRKMRLNDCEIDDELTPKEESVLKVSLVNTFVQLLDSASEVWMDKAAFPETFKSVQDVLMHLRSKSCRSHLPATLIECLERTATRLARSLKVAQLNRRPLELHHHKPLAIKMSFPKFEDQFDPTKHYDPNKDRAESARLQKEYKRERKGALRELRKDANFMAREKLRVKKIKDDAYEKKFKRLVAEIQGEEGAASNEYEREKMARKRARSRA
ncbi:putative nucleolar complex protein 14 [Ceratocystis fimbriata CBS 114723]|uniref:Putative nucleolar complex protein 14 n=1 Tax=Ceratocystis fimbriata CBS 114723 TaxID=1035309 RepID=A0A2C5WW57_9PEZI|nr:putative nucleolar complex protein 14 [Ceratocystis fimbriata CBS 114723]